MHALSHGTAWHIRITLHHRSTRRQHSRHGRSSQGMRRRCRRCSCSTGDQPSNFLRHCRTRRRHSCCCLYYTLELLQMNHVVWCGMVCVVWWVYCSSLRLGSTWMVLFPEAVTAAGRCCVDFQRAGEGLCETPSSGSVPRNACTRAVGCTFILALL